MTKLFAAMIALVLGATASLALDLDKFNKQFDETNFILSEQCSSTLISSKYDLVLTAYHCVSSNIAIDTKEVDNGDDGIGSKKVKVFKEMVLRQTITDGFTTLGYREIVGDIVATDQSKDLALVKLRIHVDVDPAPIAVGETPKRGETVWAAGNPYITFEYTLTKGILSSVDRNANGNNFYQFDAHILPGSSGGGLFNDNGELIGVTTNGLVLGGQVPLGGFAFARPLNDIVAFIKTTKFKDVVEPQPK